MLSLSRASKSALAARLPRALVLAATLAIGCHPPANPRTLPSPVVEQHREELDEAVRQSALEDHEGITYRVGPGDSLLITVFRHPEFTTIPFTAVAGIKPGTVVDNNGAIQFPLVGTLQVAGQTLDEIRDQIQKSLARYIPEPSVTVQVLVNGSLRYNLIGQFTQPGIKISDRPLRLLEAIALGGSIDLAHADLRGAYIARNGHKLPIDFYRLMHAGDLRENIRLHNGDILFVPDNVSEIVYVFGAGVARGVPVTMLNGRLNLVQALAAAGYGYTDHSQGKFQKVRVIRSGADSGLFFVVNAEKILKGEAAPFALEAGDLVFVPETAWTKWNQILAQILPSLQVISGLLTPFVDIKFLGGF
jgi:polysaccharide export outer membrane protein